MINCTNIHDRKNNVQRTAALEIYPSEIKVDKTKKVIFYYWQIKAIFCSKT